MRHPAVKVSKGIENGEGSTEATLSNLCILLADDDAPFRMVVALALRREGFTVLEVGDGNALQEQLGTILEMGQEACRSWLVISDVHMPGKSGLDVLRWLRAFDGSIAYIVITSAASLTWGTVQALGANGFLDKSAGFGELRVLIHQMFPQDTP